MLVIDILDFYILLKNNTDQHLNNFYKLLTNTNKSSLKETKINIDDMRMELIFDLQCRKYYCEPNSKNIYIQHELFFQIQNLEHIILDMFRKPRLCNFNNFKFVKLFLTLLDNYFDLIFVFEINTQIQHTNVYKILEHIFKNILLN